MPQTDDTDAAGKEMDAAGEKTPTRYDPLFRSLVGSVRSFVCLLGWLIGVRTRIDLGPVFNSEGYQLSPDCIFSVDKDDIGLVEIETRFRKGRIADRASVHAKAFAQRVGKKGKVHTAVVVVGDVPPRNGILEWTSNIAGLPDGKTRYVHISLLDPAQLSEEDRRSPNGRMLMLYVKGGDEDSYVQKYYEAARNWSDDFTREKLLWHLVAIAPGLRRALAPVILRVVSDEDLMRYGYMFTSPEEAQRQVMQYLTESAERGIRQTPLYRHLYGQDIEEAGAKGEAKGLAKAIATVMKRRQMPLSSEQFRQLRNLPCASLPDLDAAFDAESAEALLASVVSKKPPDPSESD